jgi:hypothetical protein
LINSFQKNIDQELYSKAIGIGETINANILDIANDSNALQARLEKTATYNKDITSLDLLAKENDKYKVVASLDKTIIGQFSQDMQNVIAWH